MLILAFEVKSSNPYYTHFYSIIFFLFLVLENDGQLEHHGKSVMDVVESVNTSVRLLNCGICLKVFKTQSLLKEHMFVHIKK